MINDTPYMNTTELAQRAGSFSVNSILKHHAYQNKPLDFETAYLLGAFTLAPYREELAGVFPIDTPLMERQSIAVLCALHNRETYSRKGAEEQIAGIAAAVFDYDIRISQNGFLTPKVPYAIDNCGMGGDLLATPNVSTIAGLVAASQGMYVCKHGSPGNTDSFGSSDFLRSHGVNLFAKKADVEQALEGTCFGYTDALDTTYKHIHRQTHMAAHLAHMNDIIGPITNPVHPEIMTRRIVGINHLIQPEVVARAYALLNDRGVTNVARGLFIRGFADEARNGGMDEASILPGGTIVAELDQGRITVYDLHASDFGLPVAAYEHISPAGNKREMSANLIAGKGTPDAIHLIAANAALIAYVVRGTPLREGTAAAISQLLDGKGKAVLDSYVALTRGDAP